MVTKTRKAKRSPTAIEHHHMLLRLETKHCPYAKDAPLIKSMLQTIVVDLNMHALDIPRVYYVDKPLGESGMTAFIPIETSHIAFHFWNSPDLKLLHNPASRSLLQFDIYTCGRLTKKHIGSVLKHLDRFQPTHANIDVINRGKALHMDIQAEWDARKPLSWDDWLRTMN